MRKLLLTIPVIIILLMFLGCGEPAEALGEVSALEEQIALLETQLSEKEANIIDLQAQLDAKSVRITALENEVIELETQLSEKEATTPAPTPTTFEPITITGSGDKTSPPFTVTTEEWSIDWSYVPDPEWPEMAVFGFFVYPRGETVMFVESVLFPEGTNGSTYSYAGAGEYYIKVSAGNVKSWQIVISSP